jgi:hypothetical protein
MPHGIPDTLVVSRLNEFAAQHKLPPLEWRIESRPLTAPEATQGDSQTPQIPKKKSAAVNVFDASCVIEGRTFDAIGLSSKMEAKRRVASRICQFYFDTQHPFFIKPVSFKAKYTLLLSTLSNGELIFLCCACNTRILMIQNERRQNSFAALYHHWSCQGKCIPFQGRVSHCRRNICLPRPPLEKIRRERGRFQDCIRGPLAKSCAQGLLGQKDGVQN